MPTAPCVAVNEELESVIFIVPRVVDVPAVVAKLLVICSSPVESQPSCGLPGVASLIDLTVLESFSK
jgi:hypothetical protein